MLRRAIAIAGTRLQSVPVFALRSLSTNSSALSSTSVDVGLPANLNFDSRSSFKPPKGQKQPVAAAPAVDIDNGGIDGDHEDLSEEEIDSALDGLKKDDVKKFVIPLPDRLQVPVYDFFDGRVNGSIALDPSVFGHDQIRVDLITRFVTYARNKIRGRRNAHTKTISEVSGSGAKIRQQKGSGRARAGHSRPAHFRGGAKAHGPKNATDYGKTKLNKKIRKAATRHMLSQKLKEGNLILVDNLKLPTYKTKDLNRFLLKAFGIGNKYARSGGGNTTALILDHHLQEHVESEGTIHESFNGVPINLWVAAGNIPQIRVANQRQATPYNIIQKDKLVLTLSALEQIESRYRDKRTPI